MNDRYPPPTETFNSGQPITANDRTWALLCPLLVLLLSPPLVLLQLPPLALVLGGVLLLVVMLTRGKSSSFVRAHAAQALNVTILLVIVSIGSMLLLEVSGLADRMVDDAVPAVFGYAVISLAVLVFGAVVLIFQMVRAWRLQPYQAPLIPRLVR